MLIEFRVENHRSLRDEQVLTLESGRIGDDSDPRPRRVEGHSESLLPAAVIYGANASGKSNVLAALDFMCEAVVNSYRRWAPDGDIPRSPFKWGGNRVKPSMFEASFLVGGIKHEYGFVLDDKVVTEEWLYAWPNNRKQVWFERELDVFTFGDHLKGPNNAVKEVSRPNALFLSAAAQLGHEQLTFLYSWFRRVSRFNVSGRQLAEFMGGIPDFLTSATDEPTLFQKDETDDTLAARIRQLMKTADVGIVDIKRSGSTRLIGGRKFRTRRLRFQHQAGDKDSWLDFHEESEGTQTLFMMAPSVFRALDSGGLLIIDELESSLHPLLGLAIVKLFNCPKANSKNAQIVFTTHDTNLLGTTLGEPPLRRDQIWFTEKEKDGASKLYPLTDFKPRITENLERGYLQGRYGAVPFLGDSAWITE